LAPETISGGEVAAAADIYALGAVAYFLLTGGAPFPGDDVVQVCAAHLHQTPTPLSERAAKDVSPALESLVMRCLAKEPALRPPSAMALERELASCNIAPFPQADVERFWADYQEEPPRPVSKRAVGVTMVGRSLRA
jgi:serine/threonine-protein kinase